MPFTLKVRRKPMLDGTLQDPKPGDYCFKHFHGMLEKWKACPRWTTAHEIYKDMRMRSDRTDDKLALELAWQVFFPLYVMPYERKQQELNGDI